MGTDIFLFALIAALLGYIIYLHILKWIGNDPVITIPDLGMDIRSCRLAHGGKVKLTKLEKGYFIELSGEELQPVNTIVELEYSGNIMNIEPIEISSNSLSYLKPLTASSNLTGHWGNHQWVELSAVTNGDWSGAFWEPEEKDLSPWIEIDLGKPEKISKAILYERGQSVKAFELQVLSGDKWKTIYKGTTIGSKAEIKIPKTNTQKVRLVLKEYTQAPGIYEIVLL